MTDTSRNPVLCGNVYCSPRCGAKCTKAAYDRAVSEADALAEHLGDGWEPRVWENMGWHYSARKGVAEVYAAILGGSIAPKWTVTGYHAFINHPHAGQSIARAATGRDAMEITVSISRNRAADIAVDLDVIGWGAAQ